MAYDEDVLMISRVAHVELAPQFGDRTAMDQAVKKLNIRTSAMDNEVAYLAGRKWKAYRSAGGSRDRIISDFIIGACRAPD